MVTLFMGSRYSRPSQLHRPVFRQDRCTVDWLTGRNIGLHGQAKNGPGRRIHGDLTMICRSERLVDIPEFLPAEVPCFIADKTAILYVVIRLIFRHVVPKNRQSSPRPLLPVAPLGFAAGDIVDHNLEQRAEDSPVRKAGLRGTQGMLRWPEARPPPPRRCGRSRYRWFSR